jgi:H+-transporting ATPase
MEQEKKMDAIINDHEVDYSKINENGLSSEEVKQKLEQFGPNEINSKKQSLLLKFLSYLWGPIPIMIEAAAILSLVVQHYTDFAIIITLLLMNTIVGFWHDWKADNAIELLKKKLSPKARVKRDGKWEIKNSRELVPGDLIRMRMGDIVPADVKLISGGFIICNESALTGESIPSEKKTGDIAYSGATVDKGEMNAVVIKTGSDTYFGKTAKLVGETQSSSHFEKAIIKIGNFLIVLAVILVVIILFASFLRHEDFMESLRFALVLSVASIPVALPAILTVTMAIGAVNLSRKNAIVSKLSAIEELAGMDVLCSDKTGTLTKNQLGVEKVIPTDGLNDFDVILYASLASKEENNDSIDNAILEYVNKNKSLKEAYAEYNVKSFSPFDPIQKKSDAVAEDKNGKTLKIAKGAPQVIFDMAGGNSKFDKYRKEVDNAAKSGFRVIGVAYQYENEEWQLAGLIPLSDPPRDDSAKTIADALEMGVKVKMITGDNIAIARQIAEKLKIGNDFYLAKEFEDSPHHKLEDIVEKADGFAEVFPEHKYTIVQILQKLKHFVGMTGDGVNDAPALKKADCGIAVDGATDVAKSAASIVLTSPGISVIIDAIKESRKIFKRMNSYAIYRIAETIRVLIFLTLSILIFNFYPVTAVMIVLLALLNDAPIIAIASDRADYSQMPEKWNMKVVLGLGSTLGIIGVISSFMIFTLGKEIMGLDSQTLQAFIFLKLAVAGHLTIFVSRTQGYFWQDRPSTTLILSAIITKVAATFFAVYGIFIAPIGWANAGIVWAYAIVAFVITDLIKVYFYRTFNKLHL